MNTAENTKTLTWTSRTLGNGSIGRTYRAEAEVAGQHYSFTVDQPRKGLWVVRGWRNDGSFLYREDRTMKGAKSQAENELARIAAEAERAAAVAPAPETQRVVLATPPLTAGRNARAVGWTSVSAVRDPEEALRVLQAAQALAGLMAAGAPCPCTGPVHTMRCGYDARPQVVNR